MVEGRLGLGSQLGHDPKGEGFSKLDAPLVEAVDTPDHALRQDLVLVDGHQFAEHARAQFGGQDRICGPVARETAMRDKALRDPLSARFLGRLAEGQRFGLSEEIGHQQVVVAAHSVRRAHET